MKRSRWWILLLVVGVMVGGAIWFDHQHSEGDRELDVYVRGGERMAAGEEIYRRGVDDKPFTYPPFAALLFVPFSWLPVGWQPSAWFVINFLIVLAMGRWLHGFARAESPGRAPPRLGWFWLATAGFGGMHVMSVLTNQSHDLLICGAVMLTAAAWCRDRAAAGIWVGLGAAMKATPLLFVGLFAQRLRWRALLTMLLAIGVATFATDLLCARADGQSWIGAWYDINIRTLRVGGTADTPGAWGAHSVLNQGLSGVMHRLFRPLETAGQPFVVGEQGESLLTELSLDTVKWLTRLMFLGILALLFGASRLAVRALRVREGEARAATMRRVGLGEVAAFACGMVLLSPQSSKAHFCVWLLPVAFVADQLLRRPRRDALLLLLLLTAFALGVLSKGMVGRANGSLLLAFGQVTWVTVLLLLATVRGLWLEACDASGARTEPVASELPT